MTNATATVLPTRNVNLAEAYYNTLMAEFATMIANNKSHTFASLRTQTDPNKLSKKGNPFWVKPNAKAGVKGEWLIQNVSYMAVSIDANYQNSVNNQLKAKGLDADFVAQPRKWGERVNDSALIVHKGDYYLDHQVVRYIETKTVWAETGEELTPEEYATMAEYRTDRVEGQRQIDAGLAADDVRIRRSVKLTNILDMKIKGENWDIGEAESRIA